MQQPKGGSILAILAENQVCYATDELLDDAAALEHAIVSGFRSEFDFKLVNSILNGTGAGQPLGINNAASVISVDAEVGQLVNTINFENVVSMMSRMLPGSFSKSIWICNNSVLPELYKMSIAVGLSGVPVYMPAGGAAAQPFASLFGRPVVPIEQCPVLGDTGDISLCDFPGGYLGIDKGDIKQDVSIHVQYVYDESVFRFVYRFDGQPVLASAITPYTAGATTATATQGHFIRIAARD